MKGVWLCLRRVRVSCLVQLKVAPIPTLWTSSTWRRELGAPQLSARLEVILQPRRCRMPESRSSLVAIVRLVTSLFGVLRDGYGCEGDA